MLKRSMLAFLVFLLIPAVAAEARDYPHDKTGVTISIPDSWVVEVDGDMLSCNPKDETIALVFIALQGKDMEAALGEMEKALSEVVTDLKEGGEAEEIEVNGMKGVVAEATGKVEGQAVEMAIMLLEAPKKNMYILVFGMGATGEMSKHEKDVEKIFKSMKPIKKR